MQRYEKYKNSGVDWIGEIPEGWKMLSNKYIFKLKKNQVGKKSADYDLLSLTLKGIIKRDMENPEGKFPAEFDTYQEVTKGDFIFCLFDVEETPRTVGLSDFDGMITGAYTVFTASEKTDRKYLYYFYLNLDEKKRLKFLYRGLRNTIPKDSFFTFKTTFPPLSEQQTIAIFLDDKNSKIDQTIANKQKEIELLKERRQILIQKAVTKGLDDSVKLKDSGVDWIGEIPEHWEVRKLKYLINELNVRSINGKEELLSLSKYKGIIPKSTLEERAGGAESHIGYKIVRKNDLVINKMQAVNGLLAVSKISGLTSPDYSVYFCKNVKYLNIYYLQYLLLQSEYLSEFKRKVTGVMEGFIRLYTDDLYDIKIHLPKIEEQVEIVSYIETIEEKIAKAILLKQQEIEKMKEYKTVLIDNVVTGKVRVS